MTRVRIPAPAVEADVSADQVEAYLLPLGWHRLPANVARPWRRIESPTLAVEIYDTEPNDWIPIIAACQDRPALDVLADITGPARGVDGRRCRGADTREDYDPRRVACMVKMMAKRWRETSAPHRAQEESER